MNGWNMVDLYVIEFQDAIARFSVAMASDDLPTIDVAQAFWLVCTAFEQSNTPTNPTITLSGVCRHLAWSDYLIEHTEWTSRQEGERIRTYVYDRLLDLGKDIHAKLIELGMLKTNNERYNLYKPISDETFIFQRVTESA